MKSLLLRNLFYHWRGNLAVFLGIALGSAVLTGAVLVGDSLRGSLKTLTLDQLGWVEQAMLPGRFFREELAAKVSADRCAPALWLQGSASQNDEKAVRVGKVNVFGVDASFWPGAVSDDGGAVLNHSLAKALDIKVGDTIKLFVEGADKAPHESLLGQRQADRVLKSIAVKVGGIVADEGMGRFSLNPTPTPVRNAFVPIRFLQKKLDLTGRVNAVFVAQAKPTLQADLQGQLNLEDWGLRFRSPADRAEAFFRLLKGNSSGPDLVLAPRRPRLPTALIEQVEKDIKEKKATGLTPEQLIAYYREHRDYFSLESERMLLEPFVEKAVEKLDPKKSDDVAPRWRTLRILISLADTISDGKQQMAYAIVAGDDAGVLTDDQIELVKWPGLPPTFKTGSEVNLTYFAPDDKNGLIKKVAKFKVHSLVELDGIFDDPDLTPAFPGITDKLTMATWENPPFPYNPKRIKKADEDYWTRYRTSPKAYVALKKAQELWGSRFGDLTSIQFRASREVPETLPAALLAELKPEQGGFVFQKIRERALEASSGAIDFSMYFVAFSSFLIMSALLLVGLLVRLNLDRRAGEIGLLLALGWDHGRVRRLMLGEGTLLAIVGSAVGLGAALLYASLMLKLLAANWPGGDGLNFLTVHAEPTSFAIGYTASLAVSVLTLLWATRVLSKLSPRSLLQGETTQSAGLAESKPVWSRRLLVGCIIGALALAGAARSFPSQAGQAFGFFGSGALLLTACLAGVWIGLKTSSRASSPQPSLALLGIRNAGRNAVRSVLTVGLLASSSFLIVAIESFHKDTDRDFHDKTGGSGGFALYVEGSTPIFEDLNDPDVRRRLRLDTPEMRKAVFFPCRVQAGDDTSCLNLFKPLKPRVMGISDAMIRRGGFQFGSTLAKSAEEKANPWLLLDGPNVDGAIPAFVDANTAQYNLKVSLGESVEVNDDKGEPVKLRIVGLLAESIFQSEILISEANFKSIFPRQEGFTFFLVDPGDDADADKIAAMEKQIGAGLNDSNMDVQTTASRLQGYLAVENTYLKTFQALGGLGLILGAAGLAIVLLRGVWERRAELALLQALGFRSGQLAWLVLVENAYLLVLGLASGTVSALLAVAPHLIGTGAQVLWLRIVGLLILVLAVGLLTAALAVWSTLKTPVLMALRRE